MKKCSNSFAAICLGFGDSGKGVVTNSLCKQYPNSLVIRYSGGQQAGHTVTLPSGLSHVFSNFGAGTLQGCPTYWSEFCTFDPVGMFTEFEILKDKGFNPVIYINKNSPITTPYDKFQNQRNGDNLNHGTCGVGVGATFAREKRLQSLLAIDMLFPLVFKEKYNLVRKSYNFEGWELDQNKTFEGCVENILSLKDNFKFVHNISDAGKFEKHIFEGSQGLLLDQNIGFFPHVTRSNTGSKNILSLGFAPTPLLITRAFQTRHGNGYMTNEDTPHNIADNPLETNILNKYQGKFRKSLLDLNLLKYGIERDNYLRRHEDKHLVITCLDLVQNEYRYTIDGKIIAHTNEGSFVRGIQNYLDIRSVHRVHSPSATFDIS